MAPPWGTEPPQLDAITGVSATSEMSGVRGSLALGAPSRLGPDVCSLEHRSRSRRAHGAH